MALEMAEVIEDFDLEILRAQAVLYMEGDQLAMHDGDFKLVNTPYNAMHRLATRWVQHIGALIPLCHYASFDAYRKRVAETEVRRAHPDQSNVAPGAIRLINTYPMRVANDVETGAYAGAILVIVDSMIERFRRDMGLSLTVWRTAGKLIDGFSFGAIARAGANSFRHYDEWRGRYEPKEIAKPSWEVIQSLVFVDGGGWLDMGQNHATALYHLLEDGDGFTGLGRGLFDFAKAMQAGSYSGRKA